jgi:hypothetical protein
LRRLDQVLGCEGAVQSQPPSPDLPAFERAVDTARHVIRD